MAKKAQRFSMRPEMAEEGILSDANIVITGARICQAKEAGENFVKGGREPEDPVAEIEYQYLDEDMEAIEPEEPIRPFYLSAGKATRLAPSEDGEEPSESGPFLVPVEGSSAKGLNKNCNLYQFYHSCQKPAAGKLKFDTAVLDDQGIEGLVGMKLHVLRVPAPEIGGGMVREEGARERTIITCHEIYELPGKGKGKVKGKVKAKAEKEEEAEAEGEDDVKTEAQGIVVGALEKAGSKGLKVDKLIQATFGAVSKSKNRKAILELLKDDDFISDDEAPWSYDEDDEKLTPIG